MAFPGQESTRPAWRLLMLCGVFALAACEESPAVLSVKAPTDASRVRIIIQPGQRVDFDFDLSTVTPIQRDRDLLLEFAADAEREATEGSVLLENFFGVSTPPTVRLKDNRIIASGEVIAVANAERKDALEMLLKDLGETAAGGSFVSAGIPLFSYLGSSLAERFRSRFSAADEAEASLAGGEAPPAARGATPLAQVRNILAIVHAARELAILQDYQGRLGELQETINRRNEMGVASRTDRDLIEAWMLNAEQKRAQFRTALDLARDDVENRDGTRPPAYSGYPTDWDARMPDKLDTLLEGVPGQDRAAVRQYWRLASLEAGNRQLQGQLKETLQQVHASILKQFEIGQRSLSDVLTSEKGLYENAIVSNDTEYRLCLAQAELYAVLDRLPSLEPDQWASSEVVK